MSRLVEPTSVTTASGPQASSAVAASSARPATGAAQKTTSAPSQASPSVLAPRSSDSLGQSPLEGRRIGVEAGDLALQPPPGGEPDRASDQADAENGDPHSSPRRACTAAPNWRSSVAVVSQSMQASVIDCP